MKPCLSSLASVVVVVVVALSAAGCPPSSNEREGEEGEGEEGEGEEGEGEEDEGEGTVFDCDNPSPDTLAATVGAGWQVVRSFDGAALASVDRVAVDGAGRTVGFNANTGLLEELGTWPDVASTGVTQDPILPEHRAGVPRFFSRSAVFEDDVDSDTLIFTYALGVGGEVQGGLFIDRGGEPTSFRVDNPFGARLVGSRLLVSAAGLLGQGAATVGTPVQVWGLELQAAPAAFAVVTVAQPTSDVVRINRLGDDVLLSLFTADVVNPTAFDNASHRFAASVLAETDDALPMPAPAAGIYDGVVMDAFDVDGGVVVLEGVPDVGGASANVEFIADDGYGAVDVPLVLDSACLSVGFGFAAEGDAVIALLDLITGDQRIVQLRRE